MRSLVSLPILLGLLLVGCSGGPSHEPRHFPTAEQAIGHWHSHEGDFRQLVAEWRESSGQDFTPYPDSWWWNSVHARKTWGGLGPWHVTRPAAVLGTETQEDFWSLDEAANFAGLSGKVLASLLRQTPQLQVRSLDEVVTPTGRSCTRFDLEGGWMGLPNGFLQCIGTTTEIRLEQVH